MKYILLSIVLIFSIDKSQSQIMGSILGEATRKINRKVEDKLVQVISDEIVRRAFKPVERTMDSLMRERFQDSIGTQEEVDWDKWSEAYTNYLSNMNAAVDLPPSYSFDVIQMVETTSNKEKSNVTLYYSENQGIFGIETEDKKEGKSTIVLDVEKDAAIMYSTDKKGNKSGQVVPNFFKMMSSFANDSNVKVDDEDDMKFKATGKTKKVAGYTCQEYKGESKEDNISMYLTQDFPVKKDKSMESFFMKFAPESYNKNNAYKDINGVVLEYENISKTKKSETNTWVTKSVKKEAFKINNDEYGLMKE